MKLSQKSWVKKELILNFRDCFGLDNFSRYKSSVFLHERILFEFDSYLDGINELGSISEFNRLYDSVLKDKIFEYDSLIDEIRDYGM